MRLYVHTIVVTAVTTDANPGSVAMSVDVALTALSPTGARRNMSPLYATDAQASGQPRIATIPDEPQQFSRRHDDWMNEFVIPLCGGSR